MNIYWLMMLDNIVAFCFVAGAISFFLSIPFMAVLLDCDSQKRYYIFPALMFLIGVCLVVVGTFTPTTKQMAVILVAPKVINNEQVQELPNQIMELANDWLKELRPNNEGVK